jgi:hypothetical protein
MREIDFDDKTEGEEAHFKARNNIFSKIKHNVDEFGQSLSKKPSNLATSFLDQQPSELS